MDTRVIGDEKDVLIGRIETLLAIIETLYETQERPTKRTLDRAKDIARGMRGCER